MRRRTLFLILTGAALVAGGLWGWQRVHGLPDLARWDAEIEAAAAEFGLEANVLRALVATESRGEADARSRAGARGLTQLMPATAREQAERLRIEDYDDGRIEEPRLNLRLGASYLARMLRRFDGQLPFALAAYNAGATRVTRWREAAPPGLSPRQVIEHEGFDETRAHMERALRYLAGYRAQYGGPPAPTRRAPLGHPK